MLYLRLNCVTRQAFLTPVLLRLELDEDGKRFDIECDERVDNIHFRFEDDVKLELNKTGDAYFQW